MIVALVLILAAIHLAGLVFLLRLGWLDEGKSSFWSRIGFALAWPLWLAVIAVYGVLEHLSLND